MATPPTLPALVRCVCGFVFRTDYPARAVFKEGEWVLVPVGHLTVDGVPHHELPMLHRALGGCPHTAKVLFIRATESRTRCGWRCFAATGTACDCECRGARHGLYYRESR